MIKKGLKLISSLIFIIYIVSLSYFAYHLLKLNIIPNKYLLIGYGICLLFSFLIYFAFSKILKILNLFLSIIGVIVLTKGTTYFTNTYNFLKGMEVIKTTTKYSVLVLNSSEYEDIIDLDQMKIGYVNDNHEKVQNKILEKIKYEEYINNDGEELKTKLFNQELAALCLEDSYLSLLFEADEEFQSEVKVIYQFDIEEKVTPLEATNINAPFVLYISGIDQYGDINNIRGRSDVNILAVVNPNTNKILLVNTPRDYYVALYGTTGLKDKLTHAGIYGIDKSMKTLENLYNVDVNYYLRVNFDTLVKVVDIIDGIDVYSDSTFKPWTNSEVLINEGWNHFDGKEALAYARERKSYLTGDNHRGQNQQQIITAIIEKVTKSSVLISKYNDILESLDGSFQTNVNIEMITSFLKNQINKMFDWEVESIQVTGYDSKNYTYSMPSSMSYVMEPNMDSVNAAKVKMQSYLAI